MDMGTAKVKIQPDVSTFEQELRAMLAAALESIAADLRARDDG